MFIANEQVFAGDGGVISNPGKFVGSAINVCTMYIITDLKIFMN